MTNINCIAFRYPDRCVHPLAPKNYWFKPRCIELEATDIDPRRSNTCQLKHPNPKPALITGKKTNTG